jgi:6-pyruvoyltetrahydropterin/6-carboxytetrahydropterin synthase
MFEIEVQAVFAAGHAITIGGRPEPVHGHNWHVTVTLAGERLDHNGLLCDFHVVERALLSITGEMNNRHLNELAAFDTARDGLNPSAENVCVHIARRLERELSGLLPISVRIARVRVTEAPGCAAVYDPGEDTARKRGATVKGGGA